MGATYLLLMHDSAGRSIVFLETLCESQGAPGAPWRRAPNEVWNETVATLTLMALGPRDLGMGQWANGDGPPVDGEQWIRLDGEQWNFYSPSGGINME